MAVASGWNTIRSSTRLSATGSMPGAPPIAVDQLQVDSLEIFPRKRVGEQGFDQQLRVVARFSDGAERDVTAVAIYDAIDKGIVSVTDRGHVKTIGRSNRA